MSEIKWIKLSVGLFDDEKIKAIETMPEADSIIVIWLKLITMAGKVNAGGFIMLTESIPYTEEMLISLMGKPINTVKMAFKLFQQFGMIEMWGDGRVYLPNWEKHQNIDGMEKIRNQARLRKQKHRARQKLYLSASGESSDMSRDGHVTVTKNVTEISVTKRDCHATDIDIDIDNTSSRQKNDEARYLQMAQYFHSKVMEHAEVNHVAHLIKTPNFKTWADDFRKIIVLDKRDLKELKQVIDWCTTDSFWSANILSPKKLRSKYTELAIKMQQPRSTSKGSRSAANKELLQQRMKEVGYDRAADLENPFTGIDGLPDGGNN